MHNNFTLLRNLIEFYIYKKIIISSKKTNILLLYSKLIAKIDSSMRYNLDLSNLFFEIKKNYLDAK